MIDEFLKQLFLIKTYTLQSILLYILAGLLAGSTRLVIKDNSKADFKKWWLDGSLIGACLISVVGAILFDNNFLWAFLGGYFFVYILECIEKLIKKGKGGKD